MSRAHLGFSNTVEPNMADNSIAPGVSLDHLLQLAQIRRGSGTDSQPAQLNQPPAEPTPQPSSGPDAAQERANEAADFDATALPAVDAPALDVGTSAGNTNTFYGDLFDKLDAQFAVDLFEKGGPVVAILFALSMIALTVVVLKIWQFTWLGVGSGRKANSALTMWIAGQRDSAYASIKHENNPSALVLAHGMRGVSAGAQERVVQDDVERVALTELSKLRSYMPVIEATVQIAPLLGLFGTVIGMISAFQALQAAGSQTDPAVLAGGIWVALLTTAIGLAIAIPAAFINYWLNGRIESEKQHMEIALTSLFTQRITDANHTNTATKARSEKVVKLAAE